jgi:hypothetical protein
MSRANWTFNRIAYLFEENLRTPESHQPFEIKGSGGFQNGLMFCRIVRAPLYSFGIGT